MIGDLQTLAAKIRPGTLLAIPPDYSGVSMAATRVLLRAGVRDLNVLCVPTSGLQIDVLIGAGCVAQLEAAAVTLGEFGPAPRFTDAILRRRIAMRDTTCPAVHAALQASEKGIPFMPLRGLVGSDIAAHRSDWRLERNPFAPDDDPIVFLPAIRPDVALFHAAKADRSGNVWVGRRRELMTMAHAAKTALVTVEEIVDHDLLGDETTAAGVLPALYVGAVAAAPRGAWPLGLAGCYPADEAELARYVKLARDEAGFARWLDLFLAERLAA